MMSKHSDSRFAAYLKTFHCITLHNCRDHPRPPASLRSFYDGELGKTKPEAVPSHHGGIPKARRRYSDVSADLLAVHQQPIRSHGKDPSYLEDWITHSVESIPMVDSLSEDSSLFSFSEEGTCSTPSTKDSTSMEDFSDYLFGGGGAAGRLKA